LPASDGRPVVVTDGGAEGLADREVAGGEAGVSDHGPGRALVPAARTTPVEPTAARMTAALTVRIFARADLSMDCLRCWGTVVS
jgi:hypothetical protein